MRNLLRFFSHKHNFFINFFQFLLKNNIFMADVQVIQILHQGLHMIATKLSGRRHQPLHKSIEFTQMIFEVFDAGLPLLAVFLLIEVVDLFVNLFDDGHDPR